MKPTENYAVMVGARAPGTSSSLSSLGPTPGETLAPRPDGDKSRSVVVLVDEGGWWSVNVVPEVFVVLFIIIIIIMDEWR
jgi:hypothetical protein